MAQVGALGSKVIEKSIFSWPVPDDWTLAEAATVPVVYTTVLYGLCIVSFL